LATISPSATAPSSSIENDRAALVAVPGANGNRAAHVSTSPRRRLAKARVPNAGSTWRLKIDVTVSRDLSRHG
jgi:hypothetical protein